MGQIITTVNGLPTHGPHRQAKKKSNKLSDQSFRSFTHTPALALLNRPTVCAVRNLSHRAPPLLPVQLAASYRFVRRLLASLWDSLGFVVCVELFYLFFPFPRWSVSSEFCPSLVPPPPCDCTSSTLFSAACSIEFPPIDPREITRHRRLFLISLFPDGCCTDLPVLASLVIARPSARVSSQSSSVSISLSPRCTTLLLTLNFVNWGQHYQLPRAVGSLDVGSLLQKQCSTSVRFTHLHSLRPQWSSFASTKPILSALVPVPLVRSLLVPRRRLLALLRRLLRVVYQCPLSRTPNRSAVDDDVLYPARCRPLPNY